MSTPTTQRPPQVTLAGWVVIAASVIVVLTVTEYLSTLRSLEVREGIEDFLGRPPGNGTGLDVEGAIGLLHLSGMVAAGCATATAILGWYVLRRDTSARLALAVLAVPLFITGLLISTFAASFVAAAAAMLWLSPAREWFATGQWTPPPSQQSRTAELERRSPTPDAGPSPSPYGATTPLSPAPATASASAPAQTAQDRPNAVVAAVVLTTTLSVLVALLALLGMVLAVMSPELLLEESEGLWPDLAEGGTTVSDLQVAGLVSGGLQLLLCGLALLFAGFLTVGREWARRGLMATAAFSAGMGLLLSTVFPPALLVAGAAIATVVLLARPDTRAWCRRGRPHRSPG